MNKKQQTRLARDEFIRDGGRPVNKSPSILCRFYNFSKAIIKDIFNNHKRVDFDEYQKRLKICKLCDLRRDDLCTHRKCGCILSEKAWWDSEHCPIWLW
jgi:hypothetical protein